VPNAVDLFFGRSRGPEAPPAGSGEQPGGDAEAAAGEPPADAVDFYFRSRAPDAAPPTAGNEGGGDTGEPAPPATSASADAAPGG
jgi:hypothetical protein